MESSLQDSNKRYTDGIKQAKEEYNQELNEAINKLTLEKENLEAKLDTKKQELRNSQLTTTREINQLEKEKALMTEKFSQLEQKK